MQVLAAMVACLVLLATALPAQDDEFSILLEQGQKHLDRGNLTSAERAFDEILEAAGEGGNDAPAPAVVLAARLGFSAVALRRGRYDDVLRELGSVPEDQATLPPVVLLRSAALQETGRYEAAQKLLRTALEREPDHFGLRYELGEALWGDGQRQAARETWRALAALPEPKDADALAWLGRAHLRLGERPNFEAGSRVLVAALALRPDHALARTTFGEMKFQAYREAAGFPSGERDLKQVLDEHGDVEAALLALFRLRIANFQLDPAKTEQLLDRVLTQNPRSVEGLLEKGRLLLGDRRIDAAAQVLDQALQINPEHRVLLAHRAAAAWLRHDEAAYAEWRRKALRGDQPWGEVDRVLGDTLTALYRFADAVPFHRAAVAASPQAIPAMQGLAKALIYTGEGEEAKKLLLQAKDLAAGLHDPWRNNAIAVQELLEQEYRVLQDERFRFFLHRDQQEVLAAYLVPVQLRALEVLAEKYGYRPDEPVRVEVFRTWDDFSVRTVGFRGFTALGACFGPLITLVSPGDGDVRKLDFMWEATVWHEFSHVLTLGVSRGRVPRWLTEGFAVYEEKARDPSWERGMDRELFDAFHNQDLPPVALLNRLFRGPRILFGYYQGGLIVELLARDFGFDKALALLVAYGADLDTEQVFEQALGIGTGEFDRRFRRFVAEDKLKGMKLVPRWDDAALARLQVAAMGGGNDLQVYVDLAWACLQRDNPVDAGRWLAEALRRDPEHGPALLVRAALLASRGEIEAALANWRQGFAAGADDFDSRIACGRTLLQQGDADGAEQQFQRAKACWPMCTEQDRAPELLLARLYREQGRKEQALMELKAYCKRSGRAFQPRWELAQFDREAGQREAELRWLRECNRIDPFMRELHVRMADALLALGQKAEAAQELVVAAAILPAQDRQRPETMPEPQDELEAQAQLRLRAAKLLAEAGDLPGARALCERVVETPELGAATEARRLLDEWRGR